MMRKTYFIKLWSIKAGRLNMGLLVLYLIVFINNWFDEVLWLEHPLFMGLFQVMLTMAIIYSILEIKDLFKNKVK